MEERLNKDEKEGSKQKTEDESQLVETCMYFIYINEAARQILYLEH